jgi:hypothetical protein
MTEMRFLSALDENWLFRAKRYKDFTAREIVDLAFLYMVALHILRCEYLSADWAVIYAKRTISRANFKNPDFNNTDLYQFLNMISDPTGNSSDQLAGGPKNELLWSEIRFNPNTIRVFLQNMAAKKYNIDAQKRLLFQIENQLHVTVSNYRSIRRIAVEWNTPQISAEAQKLSITRLLQAIRFKARRGDILPQLEKISQKNRFELFGVCDPETGSNCDVSDAAPVPKQGMGFLKSLALGALAGAAIGHVMSRKGSK